MNIYDLVIVQPIFNLLTAIYSFVPGNDFGVALILFTILIRLLMYPLVKRQLHQTKMMRKLQPQLQKIKKAAKGNRQLEAMQMMELYKRYGVSPFRSIGLLIIQLPIFIGLYHVIQIFTSHRDQIAHFSYDFIESLGPVKSLIEDPASFSPKLFGIVDLSKAAISNNGIDLALLFIVILSAVTQYIMSRQTLPQTEVKKGFRAIMKEAAAGGQTDQSEINAVVMQKMIKVMPLLLAFIMLSLPGALALYYMVSNLVAVAQQSYLLRQDEEELEEIAETEIVSQSVNKNTKSHTKKAVVKEAKITRIVAKDSKKRRK